MNEIKELFVNMTTDDLLKAVEEIKESDETGVLCDGIVREYTRKTAVITGIGNGDWFMTVINILKEAAFRWSDLVNNLNDM